MTKSLWFKRTALLMCLLVLFLCLVPGFQQPAKAVALVDDVALFLIGSLAAFGITLVVESGSLSDAIDHIAEEFSYYVDSIGETLSSVLAKFAFSKVGRLLFTSLDSIDYVQNFASWYVSEHSLSDNDSFSVVFSSVGPFSVFDVPFTYYNAGQPCYQENIVASAPVYLISGYYSSGNTLVFVSSAPFSLTLYMWNSFSNRYSSYSVGSSLWPCGLYASNPNSLSNGSWATLLPNYNRDDIFVYLNSSDYSISPGISVDTTTISIPTVFPVDTSLALDIPGVTVEDDVDDALSAIGDALLSGDLADVTSDLVVPPEPPSTVVLDPSQVPLPVVVQGTVTTVLGGGSITVGNGADAAIPVYLPGGITVSWPIDGVPIDWPADGIPIDWGDAPSITMELPDTFFDDLTGAISDALDESYGLANQYKSPGLSDIFPFCIPFDIYHFFEALAADPVAPCFEIPFYVEGLVDYTFEIDLSVFESVAQVVRIMELLLFCVGLALVTRNLIRG